MDLTDLATVVSAAKLFLTLETSLHGLINNAGIMATPFSMTKDGHEAQWQTNYLAHWVFTNHLLRLMLATSKTLPPGSVRIVNLSSSGHLSAPKDGIHFADTNLKDSGVWPRYGQSKLANILHTSSLNLTYGPSSQSAINGDGEIWISSVHPGLVETNLSSSIGESSAGFSTTLTGLRLLGLTMPAEKGSWTSLYCVASQKMKREESGGYFEITGRWGEPGWRSADAKDAGLAKRLEGWTRDAMGGEGWVV